VNRADVSVVIPCFNSASTLGRALASVVAQSLPPREVIVVDDGSTDDVASVVEHVRAARPHFDLRLSRRESNHGPSVARNHGWDLATSTYVAFLDADDEWFPSKLEIQFDLMRSHPTLVLSGHRYTESLVPMTTTLPVSTRVITLRRLLFRNYFCTPSVMISRDAKTRFRREWTHSEDYMLWLETVAAHGPALLVDAPLVRLHKAAYGASGLSSATRAMQSGELRAYRQLHRSGAIGRTRLAMALCWSSLKYLRRIAILRMRSS